MTEAFIVWLLMLGQPVCAPEPVITSVIVEHGIEPLTPSSAYEKVVTTATAKVGTEPVTLVLTEYWYVTRYHTEEHPKYILRINGIVHNFVQNSDMQPRLRPSWCDLPPIDADSPFELP